jgi:hypothetical protein
MSDHLLTLWKYTPVVALLVLALYAGSKGFWYWGKGVRAVVRQLECERDEWKSLAITLLRKDGVELPEEFLNSRPSMFDLTDKKKLEGGK